MQQQEKGKHQYDTLTYLLFVALVVIWGAAYYFMHEAVKVIPALQAAMLRIAIAALSMLPMAVVHIKKVPKKLWITISISGVLGNGLPAILYMFAMKKVDSNIAGILNALTPIWVIVLGFLFFKKRISSHKLLGILLGFGGICFLFLSKGQLNIGNGWSLLLILGATFSYGLNLNILEHYLHEVPSRYIGSLSLLAIGGIYIIALLAGINDVPFASIEFSSTAFLYLCILGVLGTALSNILFFMLVKRSSTNFASMVTYMMPLVSIVLGYATGETILWQSLVCFAMVLIGVLLVKKK